MPDRRAARDCNALTVSLLAAAILLLVAETKAGESPVLVRLLVRGQLSVTTEAGVLLADGANDLRILI
jgi:hypothetical protein